MRTVKFLAGLLVAAIVHALGVRLFEDFSSAIDVFLVVALFNALGGSPLAGLLGGLVTGWCADVMTGGLYGAYGFCNTLVGYGAAVAAQRLVIEKTGGVFLLFSLGAAVQQLLLVALLRLLRPGAAPPELMWLMIMLAAVGVTGAVGFLLQGRAVRWRSVWRRNRSARLR
jgi:rod shape-determining protein MreD